MNLNFSEFEEFLNESQVKHPKIYDAPEGSERDRKLDKAQELLKQGKKKEAYKLRDEMEAEEREDPNWKNKPRKDSKTNEANKGQNLSKETLSKIREVAKKKGYTFGSVKQEYIKGLGAFYSSGSRRGMTAHQWAMARINAASPGKKWAIVEPVKK
jgi:hypothetical protein